ncbi:phosphotransferase [Streptomyces sp. J2-1]|uniref:phosphotransferase family protein n=1 Tax=Streptomyces corallincola TaxID=2851888 RepID=UPI001C382C2A|nr:phosphotransferase [Streptomyces corallincola]MBV2355429.1 phosphotransferase [Streptomyces corallincola]
MTALGTSSPPVHTWSAAQLTTALRETGALTGTASVTEAAAEPVGGGLLADTFRLRLRYAGEGTGPATLVAKMPSLDPTAARTAAALSAYEREAVFYRELAPRLAVRTPAFHGTLPGPGGTPPGVLLEDLCGIAVPGDQLGTAPVGRLERARAQLAALQAPSWGDPETAGIPWLHRRTGVPIPAQAERYARSWASVRDRFSPALGPAARRLIERFGQVCSDWAQHLPGPFCLTHHDFRYDNMMFSADRTWVLDWQIVGWGVPLWDLAYLVGSSLDPSRRRRAERDVVRRHAADLAARGVPAVTEEWTWAEYRRLSLAILLVIVPAAGTVISNGRGDAMMLEMLRRGTAQALDLGAEEFLPA